MRFTLSQIADLDAIAKEIGVPLPALAAVVEVESAGVVLTRIAGLGRELPVIRWEGHYFDRLVPAHLRDDARDLGLSSPRAQGIRNPRGQEARYAILLRAAQLDEEAAYSSISIGVGQVMGSHFARLGFSSARAMFEYAATGFRAQVDILVRYVVAFGLLDEIERQDWAGFARGYNGPNFRKFKYDEKLAAAFRRHGGVSASSSANGMLRMGASGERVRELQTLLNRAGAAIRVDGDFGPSTRDALKAFQTAKGLRADGLAGPMTMRALEDYRQSADEEPGRVGVLDTPEAPRALAGSGAGVGVAVAADKLTEIAERLEAAQGLAGDIGAVLYGVAGLLVVGGLLYGAWGYVRSRATVEGLQG